MSVVVNLHRCNGCNKAVESRCETVCPGNLMTRNQENKAYIRSKQDCWDCMACVKACPQQAIETKLPYELAGYGAKLTPKTEKNQIVWNLEYPDGRKDIFVIPTESI
ncbi:hypothetical protein BHU72_06575 [Desulfuribacillus stibiiarsenatis]|uniref:4Fe-4S ferredoxin-type domain-containing protein n=1 Tax=Desulfuribacillus stibiiarsenatis TaxID=1390249 RepID=A0A1E5L419_9FIRM|nr:4Fe-4S dicluster domain-containing protein [Desulfuribacillus stibiiarsenatis]OEH84855.1 hypothetical protein BHU72_06575 [Desulfuribacillus stibiiarsenatis]